MCKYVGVHVCVRVYACACGGCIFGLFCFLFVFFCLLHFTLLFFTLLVFTLLYFSCALCCVSVSDLCPSMYIYIPYFHRSNPSSRPPRLRNPDPAVHSNYLPHLHVLVHIHRCSRHSQSQWQWPIFGILPIT